MDLAKNIELSQQGDKAAYTEVVRHYQSLISGITYSITEPPSIAIIVAQSYDCGSVIIRLTPDRHSAGAPIRVPLAL